jgi:HEAT repeat protein
LEKVVKNEWHIQWKKNSEQNGDTPRDRALVLLIYKEYRNDEDKLIELLDEDDFSIKTAASDMLKNIPSRKAEDKLIKLLDIDDGMVLFYAIIALKAIKSKKAEKKLVELLDYKDGGIRHLAKRGLEEIRSP